VDSKYPLRLLFNIKIDAMATNGKSGDGRRHGAVKKRSQVQNPKTGIWVKRDSETGEFLDGKTSSNKPFKGVRKEK
tara:strand:+ start:772 stop:999 length:228 start_codon:yes stop_codon:yes gene_type:complete